MKSHSSIRVALSLVLFSFLGGSGCLYEPLGVASSSWNSTQLEMMAEFRDRIRVLEESLPLLACGPELRALFHDIRMECELNNSSGGGVAQSSSGSAQNSSAAEPAPAKLERGEAGTCQAQKIDGRVFAAERDLGLVGRQRSMGMHLLSLIRHEVVYVGTNGKISFRQDARLKALAAERRLPSTRFLIIASGSDVDLRARLVTERLQTYGIPQKETIIEAGIKNEISRFERPWNYKLGVTFAQMTPIDRPTGPAEPRDMERAVFVFRTDCL